MKVTLTKLQLLMQAIIVLFLLFTVPSALVQCARDLSSTYSFNASLHDDYTLYWTFNNDALNIRFAVRVRTTGWVGFGLSPNGQMPQSDVVIGWVNSSGGIGFDVRLYHCKCWIGAENCIISWNDRIDLRTVALFLLWMNIRTGL